MQTRVDQMDNYGIDVQIISHVGPDVTELPVAESIVWASRINDALVGFCQKWPGRFYFLSTLPLENIDESLKEIERTHKDLGAKGIQMFSNIKGRLASSPEFHPIYERAAEYGLPVSMHPGHKPLTAEVMRAVKLPPQLYGFILDTTMAVTSMVYQGLFEKYPNLKVHHCHLGGMVPYMMGRVDNAFRRLAKEWGIELPKAPSEYYKSNVYVDTISLHVPAMKCALEFLGVEHLLFGTDYPHRASGTPEENLGALEKMGLTEEEKDKIIHKNPVNLFGLG